MWTNRSFAGSAGRGRLRGLVCGLLALVGVSAAEALDHEYVVFIGTYTGKGSAGIYACRFDPATGEFATPDLAAATDNPSFLTVDPKARLLYAVNELDTFQGEPAGAVSVFAIEQESGQLKLLQQVSSLGKGPAHLSLDQTARYLLVANYGGGSCAVFPIGDDGRLGSRSAFVQHVGSSVDPRRQAGPHAHAIQVTNDNRFAVVADLGLDKLLWYRFDDRAGSLAPGSPEHVTVDPGAGPRHVALAPSGMFAYVVNEMASTVMVCAYDPRAGTLQVKQTLSTLPKTFNGKSFAAEVVVDARSRFLYVSNRGDDSIAVFSIKPDDGHLTPVEWVPTGGQWPRHCALDPTGKWLLVANQKSNDIRFFEINPSTGRLKATARSLAVVSPACICIARVPPVGGGARQPP